MYCDGNLVIFIILLKMRILHTHIHGKTVVKMFQKNKYIGTSSVVGILANILSQKVLYALSLLHIHTSNIYTTRYFLPDLRVLF